MAVEQYPTEPSINAEQAVKNRLNRTVPYLLQRLDQLSPQERQALETFARSSLLKQAMQRSTSAVSEQVERALMEARAQLHHPVQGIFSGKKDDNTPNSTPTPAA